MPESVQKKQAADLERQIANLKSYMYAKGYEFDMITDIGSGINYNKPGLQQLIKEIVNNQVDKVIVLYKDRLLILGFELVEYICSLRNTELVIVDNHDKSKE